MPCNLIKLVDVEEMNYLAAKGEGEVSEGPRPSPSLPLPVEPAGHAAPAPLGVTRASAPLSVIPW